MYTSPALLKNGLTFCLKNQLPVWQGLLVLHYPLSVSMITESTVITGDLNALNKSSLRRLLITRCGYLS